MTAIDRLFTRARLADGTLNTLAVLNGRISAILPAESAMEVGDAAEVVDLAGELLLPSFVEGHIHLDTSFYGDRWVPHRPCTDGFDVHERVAFQAENEPAVHFWRGVARAASGDRWTEELRAVPDRPDLPPDSWISFTTRG